jgi:hypothetical protein
MCNVLPTEERIERVVLAEQHRNLKSINQQLTECCSQLDTKLEVSDAEY